MTLPAGADARLVRVGDGLAVIWVMERGGKHYLGVTRFGLAAEVLPRTEVAELAGLPDGEGRAAALDGESILVVAERDEPGATCYFRLR